MSATQLPSENPQYLTNVDQILRELVYRDSSESRERMFMELMMACAVGLAEGLGLPLDQNAMMEEALEFIPHQLKTHINGPINPPASPMTQAWTQTLLTPMPKSIEELAWHSCWSLWEQLLPIWDQEPLDAQASQRRRLGSFYTPRRLVDGVISSCFSVMKPTSLENLTVLDPTCGSGNFLIGAMFKLLNFGLSPLPAVTALHGIDLDPMALWVCRLRLGIVSRALGLRQPERLKAHLVVGNAMEVLPRPAKTFEEFPARFELIIGNPPFLNRLRSPTWFEPELERYLRGQLGDRLRPYTDASAIIFDLSLDTLNANGVLGMCQPLSLVSARDSAPLRGYVRQVGELVSLVYSQSGEFDAATHVVAPIVRRKGSVGENNTPSAEGEASWSFHLTRSLGMPTFSERDLQTGPTIADVARVTADFRDQYYWVCNALEDDESDVGSSEIKIASCGHIGSGILRWGIKGVRIGGAKRLNPRLSIANQEGTAMAQWIQDRQVPKILVATQTKTIECFVDSEGEFLPLTPVLSIFNAKDISLFHLQAALLSPTLSGLACVRHLGGGLTPRSLKLSATDLGKLPLPRNWEPWDRAAEIHRSLVGSNADHAERVLALELAAEAMFDAYGHRHRELKAWWSSNLDLRS